MSRVHDVLGEVLRRNNRRMGTHALDAGAENPRPIDGDTWRRQLEEAHPAIRAEWKAFRAAGRELPTIEQLIDEHQGNDGAWRAGLLVHAARPAPALASWFPVTLRSLARVPGLRFALWSVFEPGTELPRHSGPNAGVLRLHLGVDCPDGSGVEVAGRVLAYRDGETILFDDTVPHSAWNRSDRQRVTLFCELIRPASGMTAVANRVVQTMLGLDARYRSAPERAEEWNRALNG